MAVPGTGSTNQSLTISAFKKLAGKAHTSNLKEFYEETIPSNVQLKTDIIFGQAIPQTVTTDTLYATFSASVSDPVTVEYVEFTVESISGTTYDGNTGTFGDVGFGGGDEAQASGPHGYKLSLREYYEASSSYANAGTGFYVDSQVINETNGALQLVNPSFGPQAGNNYGLSLYTAHPDDGGSLIVPTNAIDWYIDYFNGVVFIQDYRVDFVPTYARGFIYIGKFANTLITEASSSGGGGGGGVITALNNQAENRLVTIGSTTTELDGETNLTFNGSELILTGSSIFNGSLTSSNIVPLADEQYDLGQVQLKYENLYAKFLDGGLMFTAINDEGATITRGQAVYVKGISGQTPTIALAAADDASKMPAMGLVADGTSNDGNEVRIVTLGRLNGFDTSMFSAGDTLYIQTGSGGVSGSLTNSPPTGSGALIQNIARVLKSDSSGQVRVGGAGRTNATPNLDKGHIFIGNDSDQTVQDSTIYISSSINRVGVNTTSPTHTLTVNGAVSASTYYGDGSNLTGIEAGVSYGRTSITTHSTASVSDKILGVNATASLEIRLPSAGDYSAGQFFTVKDEGGNANSYNITVIASGSQTIDGQASIVLESPYAAVNLYSNGTDKFFIY